MFQKASGLCGPVCINRAHHYHEPVSPMQPKEEEVQGKGNSD